MSIDDLPLEIIQHIFTLCQRKVYIQIPHRIVYKCRRATTQEIISLVCSKWRAIVFSTSELWNSVTVEVMFNRTGVCPGNVNVVWNVDLDHGLENVQAWLNRAGTSSISLSIFALDALKGPDVRKIRQSLLSYQIRHLHLRSIGAFLIPSDTSCHLKNLTLEYKKGLANRLKLPHLPSLPSLKYLRLFLNLYDFTDYRSLYAIPWHQLSVFDNGHSAYWPSRICLHILRQCQSLVQCTFCMFVAKEKMRSGVEDDIILPNLEILNLQFDSRESVQVDHILRPLILPNIKSLDLMSRGYGIPLDPTVIELMGRRSGFKRLDTFSMADTGNPVRVGSLLRYMPALRSIALGGGRVIFDKRTLHDLSLGIIGPYLEEMQFKGPSEFEIGLLFKAVQERHVYAMAPGPSQIKPFKSVVLWCHARRESDIKALHKEAERCSEESKTQIVILDTHS